MNILTIPIRNIRRKPSKTMLLLLVFSLGVMSIVALYQVSEVVGYSLEKKLTTFGANIVISPSTEKLSVSYGGFQMGEMFFEIQDLPEEATVHAIRAIKLQDRISAVAPKLVTMTKINNTAVALVGVHWQEELALKSYWATAGSFPVKLIKYSLATKRRQSWACPPVIKYPSWEKSLSFQGSSLKPEQMMIRWS